MSQEWPGQQPSKQRRGRTVETGSGCPTYLTAGFPGKETPWLSLKYTQVVNGLAAERRVGVREELPMQGGGGVGKSSAVSVIMTEEGLVWIVNLRVTGLWTCL